MALNAGSVTIHPWSDPRAAFSREQPGLWNDQPKPFIWHKTADEILENLANYCERISDSGH